ncbi:hypothetical protein [Serratia proteamaculans]|uniref:hypothetical protein n=1 Tax=Serratia proteamaculans TaxID=28151 RepID=UPI003967D5F4
MQQSHVTSKILAKRPSKSQPNKGIVTVETLGIKSTGETVITFERSFMVLRREYIHYQPSPGRD